MRFFPISWRSGGGEERGEGGVHACQRSWQHQAARSERNIAAHSGSAPSQLRRLILTESWLEFDDLSTEKNNDEKNNVVMLRPLSTMS
jgi:hypothetical protein